MENLLCFCRDAGGVVSVQLHRLPSGGGCGQVGGKRQADEEVTALFERGQHLGLGVEDSIVARFIYEALVEGNLPILDEEGHAEALVDLVGEQEVDDKVEDHAYCGDNGEEAVAEEEFDVIDDKCADHPCNPLPVISKKIS
ncbi:MAG: hypothetical protein OXO50_02965, partial [Caldilineaceae bacterium]|nr:hypothetical protein [Caldilineaceae bacterium]